MFGAIDVVGEVGDFDDVGEFTSVVGFLGSLETFLRLYRLTAEILKTHKKARRMIASTPQVSRFQTYEVFLYKLF